MNKDKVKANLFTASILGLIVIFVLIFVFFWHFFIDKYLGVSSCAQTEKIISNNDLIGKNFKLQSDFVLFDTKDPYVCTKELGRVNKTIGFDLVDKKWSGLRVKAGTSFSIKKMIFASTYGLLNNIEESSENLYLILQDKDSVEYLIPAQYLGDFITVDGQKFKYDFIGKQYKKI